MSAAFIRLLYLASVLVPALQAQTTTDQREQAQSARVDQVPRVPGIGTLLKGVNAGVTFAGVHDSYLGWYDVVTPAFSYTFSPHVSADVSLSIYPYRLAQNTAATSPKLVSTHGDLGDTLFAAHAYISPHAFQNTFTASMTAPSGNRNDGLGTGRVTFDLRDHIERYVGQTGLIVDLGGGDSSGLFNRLVNNDESSLGPLVHFQVGLIHWFPGRQYIQSVAYEQLPIGDQKVYTTVRPPGAPPGAPGMTVVTGTGVSEDNGFTTSVGIPLTDHLALTSYYNRSLRLHLDTVSIGMTYVVRGTARPHHMSMIDRAIREAERPNP